MVGGAIRGIFKKDPTACMERFRKLFERFSHASIPDDNEACAFRGVFAEYSNRSSNILFGLESRNNQNPSRELLKTSREQFIRKSPSEMLDIDKNRQDSDWCSQSI